MSRKSMAAIRNVPTTKALRRETNPSMTRQALQRVVDRRTLSRGEFDFPCVPALADRYTTQLTEAWRAIGRPFAAGEVEELRKNVAHALATGFAASPYARMVVTYEAPPPPQAGIRYAIRLKEHTMEEHYRQWVAERKPPLFGVRPDSKVISLAKELGPPRSVHVLDVGAGTGRNAIGLARLGYPTDALEPVPALVEQMRNDATREGVSLGVIEGDILSPELALSEDRYRLIVLAEVMSHFRSVEQVRIAFTKFARALAPGGIALVNTFLAMEGYRPDDAAREVSETAWSRIFTRSELAFITETLPFDRVSEESVYEHEKRNAPPDSWPPTGWFEDWSQGRNVFDLPAGRAPIEMRWLVYRRR
jgi:2-polyprenyl-3-methyl-5-hydroxy-6-metoxy-1,4-benzoquinol methylase